MTISSVLKLFLSDKRNIYLSRESYFILFYYIKYRQWYAWLNQTFTKILQKVSKLTFVLNLKENKYCWWNVTIFDFREARLIKGSLNLATNNPPI